MVGRTVLIHGEARKNKSYRKKYYVVNIGPDYTKPRLDYFSSVEKWNQNKDDIYDDVSDSFSFRSIDLNNLFFVDDIHRSKPKHGGLDLYMEDRHVILILSSDEVKKKWKDVFDNIIYKNGKMKKIPKIEHTLQVGLRVKPKDIVDKVNLQWKGYYRACFMKTTLMFINRSLDSPNLIVEYPFIRQWESRFDGSLRLEVGRAALIGECILILQLADYTESKAAHSMLTNCINCFKITRPDPPKLRNTGDKSSRRKSLLSYCRQSSGMTTPNATRSESCVGFVTHSSLLSGYMTNNLNIAELPNEESNYLSMNKGQEDDSKALKNVQNYFEHISRIYKCPLCGHFTKVMTFCSKCTSASAVNNLQLFCKVEALPNDFKTKLLPSIRGKAQSLTERPFIQSLSCRKAKEKQFHSDPNKSCVSQASQSSSKTSTNEMSSDSKLQSENSLSISANRHDDEIFMELDFDNLQSHQTSTKSSYTNNNQSQLKCCNCSENLIHKSPVDSTKNQKCSVCSEEMLSFSMLIEESKSCFKDWIPRTTSLLSYARPVGSCTSDYVELNQDETNRDSKFSDRYCS